MKNNIYLTPIMIFLGTCVVGCTNAIPTQTATPTHTALPSLTTPPTLIPIEVLMPQIITPSYTLLPSQMTLPSPIVFLSTDEIGYLQIFLIDESMKITQLTFDSTDKYDPSWSPDGSRIAYCSTHNDDLDQPPKSNTSSIKIIDITRMTSVTVLAYDGQCFGVEWSPVGDQLVISAWISNFSNIPSLYLINTDGSQLTRLTNIDSTLVDEIGNDTTPVWSPDGTRIAFRSNRGGYVDITVYNSGDIYVIDVVQLTVTRLTNTPGNEGAPLWSPDGSEIFFSYEPNADASQPSAIWVMNSDGTNPRVFMESDDYIFPVSWSSDGQYLAVGRTAEVYCVFERFCSSRYIEIADTNGNILTRLAPFYVNLAPNWRP